MSLAGNKVVVLGGSYGIGLATARAAQAAGARLPVGRIGRPEEIAGAVLFLMRNGYATGINLVVDGGGMLV